MTELYGLEASPVRRLPNWRPHSTIPGLRRPFVKIVSLVALLSLFGLALWDLRIGRQALINGQGFGELGRFFRAAVSPRIDVEMTRLIKSAAVTTLAYAALGTVLSATIGFVVAVVITSARFDTNNVGRTAQMLRVLIVPIRGVHEVLWALILINILGINPLVAVLAITVPFSAVSAKVFAELFAAQPRAPFESLRAMGAGRNAAFAYAVLPRTARDCISYAFYRFECAIRSAAVLGVVGAGGLGYELLLSFQSANYHEMWSFIWALIAVSAIADWTSTHIRRGQTDTAAHRRRIALSPPVLLAITAAVGVAAAVSLRIDISSLWSTRTRKEASFVVNSWLPPDLSPRYLRSLVGLARETVAISVGSMIVSAIIAVAGSLLSARLDGQSVGRRAAGWITRGVLLVARSIPAAVWAYLAVIAFFSGPLPAAIALGIYNGGVLGRMLGEVVENLDRRPLMALRATGAPSVAASLYGSVPLATPSFLTYGLYRWEVAMRETVVVGIAAAGGLGFHMKQLLASFAWPKLVTSMCVMILLTLAVDVVSARVRRLLRR